MSLLSSAPTSTAITLSAPMAATRSARGGGARVMRGRGGGGGGEVMGTVQVSVETQMFVVTKVQ